MMKMETNVKEALMLYVAQDDDIAPRYLKDIIRTGTLAIASDANTAIMISDQPQVEVASEKAKEVLDTLTNLRELNQHKSDPIMMEVSKISATLAKIATAPDYTIDDYTQCTECDGHGEVDWSFGTHTKTDECPQCDGDGSIIIREPSGYRYESHARIFFYSRRFNPMYWDRLVKAANLLGHTTIEIPDQMHASNLYLYVKMGNAEIFLMPVMFEETDIIFEIQ
jgi:excinuclease UvrABC ATPase subunit